MVEDLLRVDVCGSKYTVIQSRNGTVTALRHGNEWRYLGGDNLVLSLAQEVAKLRKQVEDATGCLVCAGIADPYEVCQNALVILEGENGK